MAITGHLETLLQQTANRKIIHAIEFLQNTNLNKIFEEVSPGHNKTIEIEGREIYAIFQEYETKPVSEVKIEGHRKYIDLQYIFEGEEKILLAATHDIIEPKEYDNEKDVHFPLVEGFSYLFLRKGEGCILFPADLHGPCCAANMPGLVKKIVIKIAVDN